MNSKRLTPIYKDTSSLWTDHVKSFLVPEKWKRVIRIKPMWMSVYSQCNAFYNLRSSPLLALASHYLPSVRKMSVRLIEITKCVDAGIHWWMSQWRTVGMDKHRLMYKKVSTIPKSDWKPSLRTSRVEATCWWCISDLRRITWSRMKKAVVSSCK